MKLGLVRSGNRTVLAAASNGHAVDLSHCGPWKTVTDLLANWESCRQVIADAVKTLAPIIESPVEWLAPIANPPKFLLLAGNYRAHVVESGFAELPEDHMTPQFFSKPNTAIAGPADPIPLTKRNTALDYEAELAVVVGRTLKNASSREAMDAIWGYTVVNDVSERRLNAQLASRKLRSNDEFFDWLTGKWFDGSAPMGPYVVTADDIPDPDQVIIRAFLNGEKVQEAPAAAMVHGIGDALSYISHILRLEQGDVVSMGTPAGVGLARGRLLQHGDLIECEADGIGRLANRVVAA